ncbi:MAG: helix-turn-helix domain-containing protein [Stellaceae bacterium]
MPGSVTSVFSEAEDFEAALRADGCLGLLVTGSGRFRARLTQVTLRRMRLTATEEQLPRITFVAVPADTLVVLLPVGDRSAPIWGGIGMRSGEFLTLGPSELVHSRTEGPSRSGSIWLPVAELDRYAGALTGSRLSVLPDLQRWRLPPGAGGHLRQLHRAAIRMAETRPETLVGSEAAHGLEQQLIHALVECLSAGSANKVATAARRRRDIAVRFEGLIQTQPERVLPITEMCAMLRVSDHMLSRSCAEQLGMSPTSYLRRRRMMLVHRLLSRGCLDAGSVSTAARRYGFRDLGRFAANYRDVFGELPSATLRRGSGEGMSRLELCGPRTRV